MREDATPRRYAKDLARLEDARRRRAEIAEDLVRTRNRRIEIQLNRAALAADIRRRRSLLETPNIRAAVAILEAARSVAAVEHDDLWVDYFALGGDATSEELRDMLAGNRPMFRLDHDRIAVALNERFNDQGMGRPLAYWDGTR